MKKLLFSTVSVLVLVVGVSAFAVGEQFPFHNGTDAFDFCEGYIAFAADDDWGEDLLEGDILTPGKSVKLSSPLPLTAFNSGGRSLDILIVDEEGEAYIIYKKLFESDGSLVIYDDDLDIENMEW